MSACWSVIKRLSVHIHALSNHVSYSEACLERPLPWETTCLEGPPVYGRKSYIQCRWICHQKTTCLGRPSYFYGHGAVFQDRLYCSMLRLWTLWMRQISCLLTWHCSPYIWRGSDSRWEINERLTVWWCSYMNAICNNILPVAITKYNTHGFTQSLIVLPCI